MTTANCRAMPPAWESTRIVELGRLSGAKRIAAVGYNVDSHAEGMALLCCSAIAKGIFNLSLTFGIAD